MSCAAGPAGWPGVPAPGQGGKAWLDGCPLLPPEVRVCVPPASLTGRQSALVSLAPRQAENCLDYEYQLGGDR